MKKTAPKKLLSSLLVVALLLSAYTAACAEELTFSKSDYLNVAEEAEDTVITLEGDHGTFSDSTRGQSGNPVVIERKGIYRITGQADGVTIRIAEPKKSGIIFLVLDHVSMTNSSGPCIEAAAAEKTILQCVGDNYLVSTAGKGAAVYAADALTVNGTGRLHIESGKNGIQCKDTLRITGAELTVRAENDGLKGDRGVLIDGGSVTVAKSYEGLEGGRVLIRSGELRITASDDGINAAGEQGLQGDVVVTGGSVYIDAVGDAIDSNHSIIIEGGVTLVEGPANGRNSIFDKGDSADAELSISGGTVLAVGSAEKAKNFSAGTQYSRLERVSGHAGDVISADDDTGIALTATRDFDCVIYSSPSFTSDNSIQISAADGTNGIASEWKTDIAPEVTDEIRTLFDKAAEALVGVRYEPLAVLGQQGELFCILCRATAAYPEASPYHALIYFSTAGSQPEIRQIREIWIDSYGRN